VKRSAGVAQVKKRRKEEEKERKEGKKGQKEKCAICGKRDEPGGIVLSEMRKANATLIETRIKQGPGLREMGRRSEGIHFQLQDK
jgi:hypothetical protein